MSAVLLYFYILSFLSYSAYFLFGKRYVLYVYGNATTYRYYVLLKTIFGEEKQCLERERERERERQATTYVTFTEREIDTAAATTNGIQ
jgi:hypothetical protein